MIVALDLGHGVSIDPGIADKLEDTLIDELGSCLRKALIEAGHQVFLCRPPYDLFKAKKIEDYCEFRASVAQSCEANLLLSLHLGCANQINGSIIFHKGALEIAVAMSDNLKSLGFYQNFMINSIYPGVLSFCSMPAILLDLLSCLSKDDMDIYQQAGCSAIAKAIVDAISNGN